MILGEGPTDDINDIVVEVEKKFIINFTKLNIKFCLSLHYNCDESFLYVKKTGMCKFKALNNIPPYFFLGSVSKDFTNNEMNEVSLNSTVYDFLTSNGCIGKEYI